MLAKPCLGVLQQVRGFVHAGSKRRLRHGVAFVVVDVSALSQRVEHDDGLPGSRHGQREALDRGLVMPGLAGRRAVSGGKVAGSVLPDYADFYVTASNVGKVEAVNRPEERLLCRAFHDLK
ncbi:MAG: hypothetical protein ACTHNJ_08905 [Frateuria sp.]